MPVRVRLARAVTKKKKKSAARLRESVTYASYRIPIMPSNKQQMPAACMVMLSAPGTKGLSRSMIRYMSSTKRLRK